MTKKGVAWVCMGCWWYVHLQLKTFCFNMYRLSFSLIQRVAKVSNKDSDEHEYCNRLFNYRYLEPWDNVAKDNSNLILPRVKF